MVTLNRRNLLRFDAAPTEVQMKLGISQVLSLPFAYNAPVIVLDFEVGNKNIIKGRFKDASRPRVFEFEIGDSVSFKPFTWKRTDSDVDPMAWEDFSKGYTYRYDAVKKVRKEKPKCGNTSYNCGKACIGLNKNCKSDPPDKPSQEKIDKVRAMGGEFKQTKSDPTKAQEDNKLTPKPPEEPNPTPGKTLDLNDLWQQTADAARSNNQEAASKHLEKWREVVSKLESGEGISKDISLREYQNLMDNLERDLTLGNNKTNAEFKKITKPISRILDKANSLNPLTPEDLEKAHPNFRPIMKRMHETLSKYFELGDKKDSAKKELDRLKQERSYNEAVILNNSKQFRETSIDNNYNELKSLARRNPNDLIQVKNPVSNLPERTVSVPKRIDEINKDIRDLADDKKAQKATDRAREAIARLQNSISDAENKVRSIEKDQKTLRDSRGETKSTPNSSGESGKAIAVSTPDKKVEQKYKDIIASSKDPKGTEKVLREAMIGGALWKSQKQTYKELLEEIEGGIVPEGYENHVQGMVDRYKPVIDAENFINKRREAVAKGDFRTKEEAELYVGEKIQSKSNKPYDYFDSPEYGKEYEKIKSLIKSDKLPPPLSGVVPSKELKQTIKQGDQLLYKKDAYSLGANSLSGYEISDAGEVVDIGFKNVKTRSNSEYMGRLYENEGTVPLDKISHIIRDGKRYKVDPSDSSPNDLGTPEAKTAKGAKGAIAKSETLPKTPKTSKPKVVDPLSLTPKPSKTTPKLIGDGTHEGTPKNAQEYYDAAARSGKVMTMKEAEDTVAAVSSWSVSSDAIRNDQKKGKFNKKAEIISDYVRNSTPYKGDIHRGIVFKNREEAMEWIKGDENGVLDNQNAHASWSSKESVAWVYTNPMMRKANKTLVGVIVSSVNKTGVSIEKLSRYKESEAEVLVPKDARHKVKSVTEKDGIIYVQTEEITNSDADKKIAPTAVQDFTAPRTLGNGTHEGTPKNAQEYSDMMAKKG